MINHSMVFENFFEDPIKTKELIDAEPMGNVKYEHDGVVYPNIALLPERVWQETLTNLQKIFGPIMVKTFFARYSFENVKPPHWAHSDREISEYLAIIYLSDSVEYSGTVTLKHKALGFETHPSNIEERKALIADANNLDAWDFVFEFPAKINRLLILNTNLIHAAGRSYGTTKEDGRLVISVFFDVDR